MPGRLHRLFRYARSHETDALENFTTEALAAAIEASVQPLGRALAACGFVPPEAPVALELVDTQSGIGDGGIVDLIVLLRVGADRRLFWFEVKAHAGLHGDQLATYRGVAQRWESSPRPEVVMLAKRSLTQDVRTLPWNCLRDAITDDDPIYWTDLRSFLEQERMADDFDKRVTVAEMRSAVAAHALLRKAMRLAGAFLEAETSQAWHDSGFPEPDADTRLANLMTQQFRDHRRLVVASRRYPDVCFGLTFSDGAALELWIEFSRSDVEAREAVFRVAQPRLSPADWTFAGAERWPYLGARLSLPDGLAHDDGVAWLRARVRELEDAGVLAELGKWRKRGRIGNPENELGSSS